MRKLLTTIAFVAFAAAAVCQTTDDPVMFEVAGQQIRRSEFMKEFLKSIGKDPSAPKTACTYEKRQALQEYVELFANFRAKIADAKALGYDRKPSITRELNQYRAELAAPYLLDSNTLNSLLREAYDRNHYIVRANHILVKCPETAMPDDTLKAYRRAMSLYDRAMRGEDFNSIALEEENRVDGGVIGNSERPSTYVAGELGYFSAFDMIYPFETAVYNLKVGEISKPVRTRFGYHVIKLLDKKRYYGQSRVQHIWVRDGEKPEVAKRKIDDAYSRLRDGESFESVSRGVSDDQTAYESGGRLPMLPVTKLPPEYVERIANGMKDGSYTKPFHTRFGWHIIKLLHHDTMPLFEDIVPQYKQRLSRDKRNAKSKDSFIAFAKEKYGFKDYTQEKARQSKGKTTAKTVASLEPVRKLLNDSVFMHKWKYNERSLKAVDQTLFTLNGKDYKITDFAKYVKKNQTSEPKRDLDDYVNMRYKSFVDETVMQCADDNLERDNAEFADLMNEYRNGLMIFAYNEDMIWSKAMNDSSGLKTFYYISRTKKDINNPDDSNYFWNERARTMVVSVADSSSLDAGKAMTLVSDFGATACTVV